MWKALIGLFVPGNFGALALAGGVIALVSGLGGAVGTAMYYNNLIVSSSTHAAQVSYDLGVTNQKNADAAMTAAREELARAAGAREQGDRDRDALARAAIAAHRPPDVKECRMPPAVSKAINDILGVHPPAVAPVGGTP